MLLTKPDQGIPLEIRVKFDLIHCRFDLRVCQAIAGQKQVIVASKSHKRKEAAMKESVIQEVAHNPSLELFFHIHLTSFT
jgi:hypothetical protein